jgi:hypothetical protein
MTVVVVAFVIVSVDSFIYFRYYAPAMVPTAPPANTTTLPGERTGLLTTPERTSEQQKEEQRPQETTLKTIPSREAATKATSSATSGASASASP